MKSPYSINYLHPCSAVRCTLISAPRPLSGYSGPLCSWFAAQTHIFPAGSSKFASIIDNPGVLSRISICVPVSPRALLGDRESVTRTFGFLACTGSASSRCLREPSFSLIELNRASLIRFACWGILARFCWAGWLGPGSRTRASIDPLLADT